MGFRKVIVKQTVADNIAAIAWFIESKGLITSLINLQMIYMITLSLWLILENHIQFAGSLSGQL
jgi:hypothetical protein